ncbi:unnamed protein product [Kuraishia capsulata CBS 1993]|uniref:DUF7702 domain-containing protein n=1 Tax=Kuraishia capsulata CBS 1993 TaxID=1382522 RepID=W6MRJ4_9ASCO|nr:uncharacterized protein KUCA_T00005322001 [Kuraishia capsulata CBS 1993]CDK29334.1 unnamed protein product [Kuraishia capsulata CBS 1993]
MNPYEIAAIVQLIICVFLEAWLVFLMTKYSSFKRAIRFESQINHESGNEHHLKRVTSSLLMTFVPLTLLILVRIGAGAAVIAFYRLKNTASEKTISNLVIAITVMENFGIAFLESTIFQLIICIASLEDPSFESKGIIARVIYFFKRSTDDQLLNKNTSLLTTVFSYTGTVMMVGIILSAAGGSMLSSPEGTESSTARSLLRAGSVLFLVAFISIFGQLIYLIFIDDSSRLHDQRLSINKSDQALLKVCLAAAPFFIVRIVYSLLSSFQSSIFDNKFIILLGDWRYFVGMQLCMELSAAIVLLYALSVLLTSQRLAQP